jgi:hypothetical protein
MIVPPTVCPLEPQVPHANQLGRGHPCSRRDLFLGCLASRRRGLHMLRAQPSDSSTWPTHSTVRRVIRSMNAFTFGNTNKLSLEFYCVYYFRKGK